MISTYAISAVNSGEAAAMARPKYPAATPPGFLYAHGAAGSAFSLLSDFGEQGRLALALTNTGRLGLATDLGGAQTWANDLAISRMVDARTYLTGTMGASTSGLAVVGGSMGGANALAWAAQNLAEVTAAVLILPVLDITDIHTNNRGGLATTIDTAYSGGWSQATYGATHNPATLAAAGAFDGLPIQLWYGTLDTLCVPAAALAFAAAVGPTVDLRPVAFDHSAAGLAAADPAVIAAFLAG